MNKQTKEQLEQAERELTLAGTRVYEAARDKTLSTFRKSKFLNVLGKEISQLKIELAICLGNYTCKVEELEKYNYSLPSTKLLKVMQEEGELK